MSETDTATGGVCGRCGVIGTDVRIQDCGCYLHVVGIDGFDRYVVERECAVAKYSTLRKMSRIEIAETPRFVSLSPWQQT